MAILLMTIGIPGSGKTTWAKNYVAQHSNFTIISPDEIRRKYLGGINDMSRIADAWLVTKIKVSELLFDNKDVILDATNVSTTYRRSFLIGLPECELMAKIFDVEPKIACVRIAQDLETKIRANPPTETVYRMYGEFLYTLTVIQDEGFKII